MLLLPDYVFYLHSYLQKGPVMKLIHIKSKTSVALPVYTSDLDNVKVLEDAEEEAQAQISKKKVRTTNWY